MAQFCYLKPYLGIENVFCRLLLRIGRMTSIETLENWANIFKFLCYLRKNHQKNIMVSGP